MLMALKEGGCETVDLLYKSSIKKEHSSNFPFISGGHWHILARDAHGDGIWKVVHRHADPITTVQPAESIIQK
jgi:hypothetical protein